MQTSPSAGAWIVGLGLVIVVVGLLVWTGALNWFGRLPGDIRHEGESTRVYVPLASMVLVSVVLSLAVYVVRKFF